MYSFLEDEKKVKERGIFIPRKRTRENKKADDQAEV